MDFDVDQMGVLEYYIHGSSSDEDYYKFEKSIKVLLLLGIPCDCNLRRRNGRRRSHRKDCHHNPTNRYVLPWEICTEIWEEEGLLYPHWGGNIRIHLTFSNYPGYFIAYHAFGGCLPTSWLKWKFAGRVMSHRKIMGPFYG